MSTIFFVEHHVQDKEAFGKYSEEFFGALKDKSPKEVAEDPMWRGNICKFTAFSVDGDLAMCFWELPAGSTLQDFQTFIDEFNGGEPMVKNVSYMQVEGSMGLQNLTSEMYILDLVKLVNEGKVQGFTGDGELFFVHHHILNRAGWDKMFGEKVGLLKDKSTTNDVNEALELGDGVKIVAYCGLGEKDAMCLWSMPKGSTMDDFQLMIDKFVGPSTKNVGYKIEHANCVGARVLHPDFYTQEVVALANSA